MQYFCWIENTMSLYSQYIFPYLLEMSFAQPEFERLRRETLANICDEILEIGFGTGLNLLHYPAHVRRIQVVEPEPRLNARAQERATQSGIAIEMHAISAEKLPFANGSFDSVVSTWTLCSISNVDQAMREIHRVLKPDGRFFFVEHGLSPEPNIQIWQKRLSWVYQLTACGCHLERNIPVILRNNGFECSNLHEFYLQSDSKLAGYTYQGVASKF
jgi:ubiquinone/menaquinone biosynthesis C-methylase UbiE